MARKSDILGAIAKGIDKGIKAQIKENERQQRLYQKECAREEKERQKRNKLKAKESALLQALNINWKMKTVNFTLLSLKNEYKCNLKIVNAINNIKNINQILDELKYGHRMNALSLLLSTTTFTYNQAIDIIRIIENDLLTYLKNTNNYYDEDEISTYEFASQDEIFEINGDVDYETSKAEVYIECAPLETEDVITSKEPNVLNNKIIKILTKLNDKYINELYKFHEKRENLIIENLNEEYFNILEYVNDNYFLFENLLDNSYFKSKLTAVKEPVKPKFKNILSSTKELEILKGEKPKEEDITLPTLYKILLHTPLKNISINYINKELNNLIIQYNKKISEKEAQIKNAKNYNNTQQKEYDNKLLRYKSYIEELKKEKETFIQQQKEYNESIYLKIKNFENGNKEEVIEYYYNNLLLSPFPFLTHKDIEIDYNSSNKLIVINYSLPNKEDICNLKRVTLAISKKEFKPIYLKDNELNALYNDILYKICLRTISEIFDWDKDINFIESIIFNGVIKHINKINGQEKISCIMTLQANKGQFENIDIHNVNAKKCFKSLKGIAAPELASLIPVQPILMLNKNDTRFVDAYNVIENVENDYNLATMHWKDFENLVRELFEKEFCTQGSEVKITQSSHDGGVDAVIFDADPIRGGKIIIQAKRYTNIVGVSNVRDLYGTVLNEGAIKGILVTTSDYGTDSYEFAKGKPLTLLNGNNLLHLLEKQGKKASINLQAAKEYFKNNSNI